MTFTAHDDGYMRLVGSANAAKRYRPDDEHTHQLGQEVAIQRVLRFIGRMELDGSPLTTVSRRRLADTLLEGAGD